MWKEWAMKVMYHTCLSKSYGCDAFRETHQPPTALDCADVETIHMELFPFLFVLPQPFPLCSFFSFSLLPFISFIILISEVSRFMSAVQKKKPQLRAMRQLAQHLRWYVIQLQTVPQSACIPITPSKMCPRFSNSHPFIQFCHFMDGGIKLWVLNYRGVQFSFTLRIANIGI